MNEFAAIRRRLVTAAHNQILLTPCPFAHTGTADQIDRYVHDLAEGTTTAVLREIAELVKAGDLG